MARLLIRSGERRQVFAILDDEFTLGAGPHNVLRLDRPGVEPTHLRFFLLGDDRVRVEPAVDEAELRVGGRSRRAHMLSHGDRIDIADVALAFWEDGCEEPEVVLPEPSAGEVAAAPAGLGIQIQALPGVTRAPVPIAPAPGMPRAPKGTGPVPSRRAVRPDAAPRRADPPELLLAGRLQPLKGPDVAVRTLVEVRRHRPDVRLRVVGGASGRTGGATEAALRTLASALGVADAVTFEPALPQAELADRMRRASVLLVPSRSETFGLVALEAQACGTPVVAARVPGLEVVVRDGGILVAGHDPMDHAAAVLRLLDDPARAAAVREAALATAAASSWERTVDRLLDAYAAVRHAAAATAAVPAAAAV